MLSIGWEESISSCQSWANLLGLTFPVLADQDGEVTLDYAPNFGGFPLLPWDAIVGVDRILALSEDLYEPSGDSLFMSRIEEVLDELFDPTIGTDTDELDFGSVHVGESADLDLTITNDMTGLLEITDISTSSGVFTVSATTGEVFAIGDPLVVTVTFAPEQEITYNETLTITSATDDTYEVDLTGVGEPEGIWADPALPQDFAVNCYPNPFNAELTIQLNLPAGQDITVSMYDAQGRQQVVNWQGAMSAGLHRITWSDRDAPSGLYFVEVSGFDWKEVQKVVLIR